MYNVRLLMLEYWHRRDWGGMRKLAALLFRYLVIQATLFISKSRGPDKILEDISSLR